MLKAIYGGDIIYDHCGVYSYNEKTGNFHLANRKDVYYSFKEVMNNKDFVVFAVSGEVYNQIENVGRLNGY